MIKWFSKKYSHHKFLTQGSIFSPSVISESHEPIKYKTLRKFLNQNKHDFNKKTPREGKRVKMDELIKKAKGGDNQAFTNLITDIQVDLYKIAKAKLKDDDDINEAIQETIIKAYSSIKKLRNEKYFKTWIIRILINECNNIYKKNNYKKSEEYDESITKEAEQDYISKKINDLDFFILIDKLNSDEKIVIVLFYLEEFSTKDIGKILKIPENTIRTRLARARKKLKNIIEARSENESNNNKIKNNARTNNVIEKGGNKNV